MQRNFSVDDILGTFWKLDTQGDTQKSPVVSIPEEDEDSSVILPPVVDSLKVIEVDKGMNRSASEYAFQEFLKVSEERGGSAAVRKSRFMVNQRRKVPEDEDDEEDDDDDDDHEDDDDDDDDDEHDDEHDNTDPPSPESPETFETKMEQQPSRQETHDLNEHPRSLSPPPPPPPPPASAPSSTSSTPVGLGSIGGVVDQVEVGVALNPLFSGLRDEVETAATATNSPQEYEYFLKHKLDLACAAVALSRGSAGGANIGPPALPANYTPPAYGGLNLLGPIGIPALPPKPEFGAPVAPTRAGPVTSGSDGSEDDDPDELGQNVAPGDLKRVKRMLSNRESARRSRRRKQAHLSELESQVAHLRVENTTIMKRLSEITIKFQEAAIENRVLKSDVAALQAKLKMAENVASGNNGNGQAGSMDGLNPNLRYMMPYTTGGNIQHYTQQARQTPVVQQQQEQQQVSTGKMGRTPSMQRVASLEHLQKRICKGATCGPGWGGWEVEGPSMVENHDD